ncbi:glycosyltransferase family 1 protein [Orrella sp. JC864]|uniref:glycosyltransferase family 1 protein n=1 Tax=Orrella sp. JC864 TaxID=3120298 RepID=UPI00300A6744
MNSIPSGRFAWLRGWPRRSPPAFGGGPAQQILIVERLPSASADYLAVPAAKAMGLPVRRAPLNSDPDLWLEQPGTLVVLVRYLNGRWRRALTQRRHMLSGLVYFMDDDLWDAGALAGLPPSYRRRLRQNALDHRAWLHEQCSEIWVSTQALAQKYQHHHPRLVPLAPPLALLRRNDPVWLCYHGTASHAQERQWVIHLAERVLHACPQVHFEIFGDAKVQRDCKGLPRTIVLHAMRWTNYVAYTGSVRRHIGLAPLLGGDFNAARGAVKFYDFARMGAVGLYSDTAPYAGFVQHGEDGLLLPNQPDLWAERIAELAAKPEQLAQMADAACRRALALAAGA